MKIYQDIKGTSENLLEISFNVFITQSTYQVHLNSFVDLKNQTNRIK